MNHTEEEMDVKRLRNFAFKYIVYTIVAIFLC